MDERTNERTNRLPLIILEFNTATFRVICANTPYIENDFGETEVLAKLVVKYKDLLQKEHALLNRSA